MKSIAIAAAALVTAVMAVPAAAATFQFSYLFTNGNLLAGTLQGTLGGDNNTITVSSVDDFFTLNGTSGPSTVLVASYVAASSGDFSTPGIVTLDGSTLDLLACEATCVLGFGFDTSGTIAGYPFAIAFLPASYDFEPFNAANWSISGGGAVPEPASWAMLIAGFGLTGAAMRRRRSNVVTA